MSFGLNFLDDFPVLLYNSWLEASPPRTVAGVLVGSDCRKGVVGRDFVLRIPAIQLTLLKKINCVFYFSISLSNGL